jgi:prophage regulatory protein
VNPADLPSPRRALLRTSICASFYIGSRERPLTGARPAMHKPDRIIRLTTVLARIGLSRFTLYRKIADGTLPAKIRITIHGAGWQKSDINC